MKNRDALLADAKAHLAAARFTQSENICRLILKSSPNDTAALFILGSILLRQGKTNPAAQAFINVLRIDPHDTEARVELGRVYTEEGRLDDAAQCFLEVIQDNNRSVRAYFHLGMLFQRKSQFNDAVTCYRSALMIEPRHAHAHGNMGLALLLLGQSSEAKASLECAIQLNPKMANVHDGLGLIADGEGRTKDALKHFDTAIQIDPDYAGARLNRSICLLRAANFKDGFGDYEWRWRLPATAAKSKKRDFPHPLWRGEKLSGQRLLIWGEQGVGDEVRLAALANDLSKRGEAVILECDERLVELFTRSFANMTIIPRCDPPHSRTKDKTIKYQCPAESLIQYVRPKLALFPNHSGYLSVDPQRIKDQSAQLDSSGVKKPRIGLSWGSYNPDLIHGKSSRLLDWAPLLKLKGAHFIDLQYGDTDAERSEAKHKYEVALTHLPDLDLKQDLDGVAALIKACDLVITVSNTTAHLAGALGVPTWVLLPYGHFQPWYWFAERTDSPWYPSVKLYRQKKSATGLAF